MLYAMETTQFEHFRHAMVLMSISTYIRRSTVFYTHHQKFKLLFDKRTLNHTNDPTRLHYS